MASVKGKTIEQAEQPYLFGELRQPKSDYLAVPEVSHRRTDDTFRLAFVKADVIAEQPSLHSFLTLRSITLGCLLPKCTWHGCVTSAAG